MLTALFAVLGMPFAASAEVYLYLGPDGERLVSDRPVRESGYRLISKRRDMSDAGHILANRPIATGGPVRFQQAINRASRRFGVDAALIEAVIQVESNFDPRAVSKKGATGLMQLMSSTARRYRVTNPFSPEQNIRAGAQHLSYLIDKYRGRLPLVLAAYNAGTGAVERYRGIPPYPETERYVEKVMSYHNRFRRLRYDES